MAFKTIFICKRGILDSRLRVMPAIVGYQVRSAGHQPKETALNALPCMAVNAQGSPLQLVKTGQVNGGWRKGLVIKSLFALGMAGGAETVVVLQTVVRCGRLLCT